MLYEVITAQQALDADSAYVMNRLMKNVVVNGTGANAKTGVNCELIGKTGTSQDWGDILFVGCTPDYISGMWYGYDEKADTQKTFYSSSARLWNNIFKDIVNSGTKKEFDKNPNVKELFFCAETGNLATDACPNKIAGYYKKTYLPAICTKDHSSPTNAQPTTTTP